MLFQENSEKNNHEVKQNQITNDNNVLFSSCCCLHWIFKISNFSSILSILSLKRCKDICIDLPLRRRNTLVKKSDEVEAKRCQELLTEGTVQ